MELIHLAVGTEDERWIAISTFPDYVLERLHVDIYDDFDVIMDNGHESDQAAC